MRRLALRVLISLGVIGAIVLAVVLSGTGNNATGKPAPALPAAVIVPPRETLATLRGKPAAINFWASWCDPCRKEAPELERLFGTLGGRAHLVGVDYTDGLNGARAFIREFHLTYPNLSDPNGVVGDRYGLTGLPTTAILDASGRIVRLLPGPQTQASVRTALRQAGATGL